MLEITLFGTFEAKSDGVPIEGLQDRRANRLLALLALERNRSVQRHWIEIVLEMSYEALRKTESVLRACLGDEKTRIKVEKNSLFLDVRNIHVDVFEFESLIARNEAESYQKAVRLYQGGLLKDWEGSWLLERREELQEGYLDALQTLTRTALQAQEYEKATTYLRRFTHVYPEMDSAWAQLIEAYRLAGNVGQADAAYESYLAALERREEEEGRVIPLSQRVVEARKAAHIKTSPQPFPQREGVRVTPLPQGERRGEAVSQGAGGIVTPSRQKMGENVEPFPAQNERLLLSPALTRFEPVGGAVPLDSSYYVRRHADELASKALLPQTSFVLIKGARQIGKTSLLARVLQQGRAQQARVLRTDWQNIPQSDLESAEMFLLNVAESIADQLQLDIVPRDSFDPARPATRNFERFMRRQVFPKVEGWLVWGIDEADRLFECAFKDDIFGMLRSWHNERSLDPGCEWERLTVVLSYATEAYLIHNMNQSPFNVGFPVELADFTHEQVEELNRRYGAPLRDGRELQQLYTLVGGHPYLLRRCLQEMMLRQWDVAEVEAQAQTERGFLRDHLERMRLALLRDEELTEAVRHWLCDGTPPAPEHYSRLCAAGVMAGASPSEMQARCRLYDQFLRRVLL